MRIATAVIAGVAALASVGGAVVGYQELAPDASADAAATAAPTAEPQEQRRQVRVRFEPCAKGFELEGDTCVRRLTRTVVVPVGSVAGGSGGGTATGLSRSGGPGGSGGSSSDDTPHFDDHGGDRDDAEDALED